MSAPSLLGQPFDREGNCEWSWVADPTKFGNGSKDAPDANMIHQRRIQGWREGYFLGCGSDQVLEWLLGRSMMLLV